MGKTRGLTPKQHQVIEALFTTDADETAVLRRCGIHASRYRRWLRQDEFRDELRARLEAIQRHSRLTIARFGPTAAAKLIDMTAGDKEETVRKACLDILAIALQTDAIWSGPARDGGATDPARSPQSTAKGAPGRAGGFLPVGVPGADPQGGPEHSGGIAEHLQEKLLALLAGTQNDASSTQ